MGAAIMKSKKSVRITENRGVITDRAGNKVLDAKIALEEPCPFCGERHVYRASELACPFERPEKQETL